MLYATRDCARHYRPCQSILDILVTMAAFQHFSEVVTIYLAIPVAQQGRNQASFGDRALTEAGSPCDSDAWAAIDAKNVWVASLSRPTSADSSMSEQSTLLCPELIEGPGTNRCQSSTDSRMADVLRTIRSVLHLCCLARLPWASALPRQVRNLLSLGIPTLRFRVQRGRFSPARSPRYATAISGLSLSARRERWAASFARVSRRQPPRPRAPGAARSCQCSILCFVP